MLNGSAPEEIINERENYAGRGVDNLSEVHGGLTG